jgi:hypothetical protein
MGEDNTRHIPAASNSISAMAQDGRLAHVEESAPEFHQKTLRAMGVGARAAEELFPSSRKVREEPRQLGPTVERGDVVLDVEKNRRGVVIQCAVEYTARGTPVHKLVEKKTGKSWRQRATKLQLLE